MQSYTYTTSGSAAETAALTTLGLLAVFPPVDTAAPNGPRKAGPMTPGGLVNKVMDTSGQGLIVTLDQIEVTVLIKNEDASAQITAVPDNVLPFGSA